MADHRYNRQIFEETERYMKNDPALTASIKRSVASQKVLRASLDLSSYPQDGKGQITVTADRSFQAAKRLGKRTAVLNFANAYQAGGGVKEGSNAQEESLCRVSTLYPCLWDAQVQKGFYLPHRRHPDVIGYDDRILTPDVCIFRQDDEGYRILEDRERYTADVITCAAPDLSQDFLMDAELAEIIEGRTKRILEAALYAKDRNIVLGAFGCGAFRCDPEVVALAMKKACQAYRTFFDEIVFAIYANRKGDRNHDVFARKFSDRNKDLRTDGDLLRYNGLD